MSTIESVEATPETPTKYYGFSSLVSGFGKMWRSFIPAFVFGLVNAIVQGALVLGDPTPGFDFLFIIGAIASMIVLWATFAILTACALGAAEGKVSFGDAIARVKANLVKYLLWTALLTIVYTIGVILYIVPGTIIAAITPFVAIAAMDGQSNPLGANFRVIGKRFFRWLITVIIVGIIIGVVWFFGLLNTVFIGGMAGSILYWLVFGFLGWWFLTSLALIYRSVESGSDSPAAGDVDVAQGSAE